VLAGVNTEGRVDSTRKEEEQKTKMGLRMRKREAEDKTGE